MNIDLRLGINPIIVKELRSRMRGARAFLTLTVVLLVMGGVSYVLYRVALASARYSGFPASPQIGQTLFYSLALLELLMVCAIGPAVTAGAISSEEEKLTYEMLMATPLHPASILWGKLVSALSYVFLLIFAAVPMASLIFIFGGVTPRDMIKTLIILFTTAVTLGVMGLFMSAWLRRTSRATVLSYLVVILLLFGTLFIYVALGVIRQAPPPRWVLVPNPMSALFSALISTSPFGSYSPGPLMWFGSFLGGDIRMFAGDTISLTGIPRPLYHYSIPLFMTVAFLLYAVSTRLVRPTRRWRISLKEALVFSALALTLAGMIAAAFLVSARRYEWAIPTSGVFQEEPFLGRGVVVERVVDVPPMKPPLQSGLDSFPMNDASLAELSGAEQSTVYAAVVRQVYSVDHTFGDQPPNFPVVYLVRVTDDTVGDPAAPASPETILADEIQSDVVAALADLPAKFLWVNDPGEAPFEEATGRVQDYGAIITLGNIYEMEDGSLLVSASLYFSPLGGMGKTYLVQDVNGDWVVSGSTGVEWIR